VFSTSFIAYLLPHLKMYKTKNTLQHGAVLSLLSTPV